MKNIIFILFTLILISCEGNIPETTIPNAKYFGQDIVVLTIDSCEYIMMTNGYQSIAHKGNCKYCLARKCK